MTLPEVDRHSVRTLFERLRKQGYVARMNFMCCSNCAGAALANMVRERLEKGTLKQENFRGAVFFHEQDAEYWEDGHPLAVRYGPVEVDDNSLGLPAKEVGQEIVRLAKELNIPVQWDEDPNTVILLGEEG